MPRVLVVRNPVSGRGRLAKRWPQIEGLVRKALDDVQVVETSGPGDATRIARKAVAEGIPFVVAAGGDGTISQVASALVDTPCVLGMLPCGTGNDLCRTLGVGTSVEDAARNLARGTERAIDVGVWDTGTQSGFFVNVAGIGFDAAVAQRINEGFRWLRGTAAYLAAVTTTLTRYRAVPLRLVLDGQAVENTIMLAAIANAESYGGGMKIAPKAIVDDGLFDIVLVREIGKGAFLRAFPSVFKGAHLDHPAVTSFRAREIVIESPMPRPFLIDGELVPAQRIEVRVKSRALKVRV